MTTATDKRDAAVKALVVLICCTLLLIPQQNQHVVMATHQCLKYMSVFATCMTGAYALKLSAAVINALYICYFQHGHSPNLLLKTENPYDHGEGDQI